MNDSDMIQVGRITGLYGVRGWVKVFSDTQPRDNIVNYQPWYLRQQDGQWREVVLAEGRMHGKGVIALLAGLDDRDEARKLIGTDIAIRRDQLPPAGPGEYYWSELMGLKVVTVDGVELGTVDHMIETGANDVLCVKGERERLIPFDPEGIITNISLETGQMTVDWDPEF